MTALETAIAQCGLPASSTRAHDVILLAKPFSICDEAVVFTSTQLEWLSQALRRHFARSARALCAGDFSVALEESCTTLFYYRLTACKTIHVRAQAVLLTCSSNAHLALTKFLERDLRFDVVEVGRVMPRENSLRITVE